MIIKMKFRIGGCKYFCSWSYLKFISQRPILEAGAAAASAAAKLL